MDTERRPASILRRMTRRLSPTCREAIRLESESLDRPLHFSERLGLRIHRLLCAWCRRYHRQLRSLREVAGAGHDAHTTTAPETMSPEARERLKQALRKPRA